MEVYLNSNYRISYNEEIEFIYIEWFSAPSINQFKDSFMRMLNLQEQTRVTIWVVDTRQLGMINLTKQTWLMDQIIPNVYKNGLVKIGFITGENKMVKACVLKMMEEIPNEEISVGFFYDFKDAEPFIEMETYQ